MTIDDYACVPINFLFYRQIVVRKKFSESVTILPAQHDKLVVHNSTKDMLSIKIHHFRFFNKYFSVTKLSQKSPLNGTFFGIKETYLLRKIITVPSSGARPK